jgi:hypothetical protein
MLRKNYTYKLRQYYKYIILLCILFNYFCGVFFIDIVKIWKIGQIKEMSLFKFIVILVK